MSETLDLDYKRVISLVRSLFGYRLLNLPDNMVDCADDLKRICSNCAFLRMGVRGVRGGRGGRGGTGGKSGKGGTGGRSGKGGVACFDILTGTFTRHFNFGILFLLNESE